MPMLLKYLYCHFNFNSNAEMFFRIDIPRIFDISKMPVNVCTVY